MGSLQVPSLFISSFFFPFFVLYLHLLGLRMDPNPSPSLPAACVPPASGKAGKGDGKGFSGNVRDIHEMQAPPLFPPQMETPLLMGPEPSPKAAGRDEPMEGVVGQPSEEEMGHPSLMIGERDTFLLTGPESEEEPRVPRDPRHYAPCLTMDCWCWKSSLFFF